MIWNMRKLVFVWLFLLMPLCAQAQDYSPLLEAGALPNAVHFLPPPPAPNSPNYYCDWNHYLVGKSVRATERGAQAKSDAKNDTESIAKVFSEPLGVEINSSKTPKLFELVARTADTVMLSIKAPKKFHQRTRPYALFEEKSLIPEDEATHNPKSSYPSGHAATGWGIALALSELDPSRQDDLLKRGFEYGQSRVIAGFHFQSDVDAGRLAASATIARLHADAEFMSLMKAAKQEIIQAKKKSQK